MIFKGKVALIAGAASGMGAATAREFSAAGGKVVIVDIDADGAKRTATAIEAEAPVIGDVSDSSFCDRTVKLTLERHGRLHVLVNCAGIIHRANAEGTSYED